MTGVENSPEAPELRPYFSAGLFLCSESKFTQELLKVHAGEGRERFGVLESKWESWIPNSPGSQTCARAGGQRAQCDLFTQFCKLNMVPTRAILILTPKLILRIICSKSKSAVNQ